ncbi:MAG: prolyl oligopeptidase family serine peptidase [Alphaproteobacteria bacterium]
MRRLLFTLTLGLFMATGAAHAADPYLWLEDVEGKKALDWVRAQNAATMATIGKDPNFETNKAQALAILTAKDRIPMPNFRGGYVYNFWQDDEHIKGIWRRTTLKSYRTAEPQWDTILDIDALAKKDGKSWVYKGANCLPPDFNRCLIYLSDGGKDAKYVREFDIPSRSFVDGGFSLDEAKQDTDWIDKDTLIVARALTPDEETTSGYPRVVRLLYRGKKLEDEKVIYQSPKTYVAATGSVYEHGGEKIALLNRTPAFFQNEYAILKPDGTSVDLPLPRDCDVQGFYSGELIISLRSDWTIGGATFPAGGYVSFTLAPVVAGGAPQPKLLFTPTATRAAQGLAVASDAVYLSVLDNVIGKVESYHLKGGAWRGTPVAVGDKGSVDIAAASPFEKRVFVTYEDFLTPRSLLSWDKTGGKPETLKSLPARFDATGLEVMQLQAKSKDGTLVPYFLVRKKGASGPLPTLLYGYGGFEVSLQPTYSAVTGKLWLEKGYQFAYANIRGGGEFGPKWHQAALKENRQRAFDDFEGVAGDLIARGFAKQKGVGIMGGSNGGLLVGVAMTQRPDLFGAVVIEVPLLDMLRYNKLLAGASWMGEYGDPDIPSERTYIEKYSPYQNLKRSVNYPVPLIWTSTRDDRVHPGHARKFAARMIEQKHKLYYFEEIEGGHSAGADLIQAAEHEALEFTYLREQLGSGASD